MTLNHELFIVIYDHYSCHDCISEWCVVQVSDEQVREIHCIGCLLFIIAACVSSVLNFILLRVVKQIFLGSCNAVSPTFSD